MAMCRRRAGVGIAAAVTAEAEAEAEVMGRGRIAAKMTVEAEVAGRGRLRVRASLSWCLAVLLGWLLSFRRVSPFKMVVVRYYEMDIYVADIGKCRMAMRQRA